MNSALPRTTWHESSAATAAAAKTHLSTLDAGGFQLSESRHAPSSRIPAHSHETDSLYLLLEGSLTEHFGRHHAERAARQLIFTPAGEPHSNQFHRRGGRCFFFELDPAAVTWAREHGPLPTLPVLLEGRLPQLARKLYFEFRRADAFLPLLVESIGLEMIAELGRQTLPRRRGDPPPWLRQAKEMLDASFAEPVSLAGAARASGSHPVHLARMFRRYYGASVGEYVRHRRIELACAQLARSKASLAEIAAACGFFDQSHFARTFRALVGMTPSQYRAASGPR